MEYREGRAESTGLAAGWCRRRFVRASLSLVRANPGTSGVPSDSQAGGLDDLDVERARRAADPVTAAYGDVLRTAKDAAAIESPRRTRAGEALWTSLLFQQSEQVEFHNQQSLDEEGLLGRAFSVSYAPRESIERESWAGRLRRIFQEYQQDGAVELRYRTLIFLARRAEVAGDEAAAIRSPRPNVHA